MKACLLAALVALTFPACERPLSGVVLPSSTSPALVSADSLPHHRSEFVVNIDQHEGRVIDDRHYDADTALKDELVRRAAKLILPATVIVRADRQVRYDAVARTLLLIREAGFSEIFLAIRLADSPIAEEYLRLRN